MCLSDRLGAVLENCLLENGKASCFIECSFTSFSFSSVDTELSLLNLH